MKGTSRPRSNRTDARKDDRPSIRMRLLDAAVASLIEHGTARTTTLEVQRRAGVSRGALLHHFPTHADLLAATVEELVRRNEQAVHETLSKLVNATDATERAIRALAIMMAQPAFMTELELWAVARADEDLRAALLLAERAARKDRERVLKLLFEPLSHHPAHEAVLAMTLEFLRGLALSGVLRRSPVWRQQLISQWIRSVQILLEHWR